MCGRVNRRIELGAAYCLEDEAQAGFLLRAQAAAAGERLGRGADVAALRPGGEGPARERGTSRRKGLCDDGFAELGEAF
jgi:hypothetical protein